VLCKRRRRRQAGQTRPKDYDPIRHANNASHAAFGAAKDHLTFPCVPLCYRASMNYSRSEWR